MPEFGSDPVITGALSAVHFLFLNNKYSKASHLCIIISCIYLKHSFHKMLRKSLHSHIGRLFCRSEGYRGIFRSPPLSDFQMKVHFRKSHRNLQRSCPTQPLERLYFKKYVCHNIIFTIHVFFLYSPSLWLKVLYVNSISEFSCDFGDQNQKILFRSSFGWT